MIDPQFHTVTAPRSLADIVSIFDGALADPSSAEVMIHDVAPLDNAGEGEVTFLDNLKYKKAFSETKAAACILSPDMVQYAPAGCHLLLSSTPYKSYALVAQAFYPANNPPAEISEFAHVHETAKISKGCVIEAGAVIAEGVVLGENCWIESNAVISCNVQIGENSRVGANASVSHALIGAGTRIYPGARVGQDGFGFAIDPAGYVKVPQLGRVLIGDHVEVGANSCIDRGASSDTVIGDGTWIDNFCQIAHNVKIGKGCVIVSHVGIAGSAVLEDYVLVGGQVGIAGHTRVGSGSRIAAQSGVIKDLPAGSEVLGSPAQPIKESLRQLATLKKLTKSSGKK